MDKLHEPKDNSVDSTTVLPSSALFPNNPLSYMNPMSTHSQTLALVAALADPAHRSDAAHALALHLGVENFLLFVTDPELGILLPAPGFPQTLPQGRDWHTFLAQCLKLGQHSDELPFPDVTTIKHAIGFTVTEGGSAMFLLGGTTLSSEVTSIRLLLPLMEAPFR